MGPPSDVSRVFVADDQAAFRQVACEVVSETCGLELVGAAAGVERLPQIVDDDAVDVLLLDARIPGEDPLGMAARLRRTRPFLRILLVSAFSVEDIPDELFGLGVGFLSKDELSPDSLMSALLSLPPAAAGPDG